MIVVLWAALALGAPYRPVWQPNEPPAATYPGTFAAAPVPHWTVPLPGPRLNAAAHTEQARPVFEGEQLFVGSAAGDALYLLDRSDGTVRRTYPAGTSVEAEPLVVADRVFFGDTGGRVWSYTLDGALVWTVATTAPILVRPTLSDGRLYVTNVDDLVVALDAQTGEMIWRYQQKPDLSRRAELALYAAPPALVDGNEVIVGFSTGDLVGLSAEGGDRRWQVRVGEGRYPDLVAEPALRGELLFVSAYFEPLVAMERRTRTVRWTLEVGSAASPLLAGPEDDAVLYHPGSDGKLRAVAAGTGDVLWIWDSESDAALTTPVFTQAGLVVASSSGSVSLIDPITGIASWAHRPTMVMEGVTRAPVIDGRQMLFVSNSGKLYSMLSPSVPSAWPVVPRRKRGVASVDARP